MISTRLSLVLRKNWDTRSCAQSRYWLLGIFCVGTMFLFRSRQAVARVFATAFFPWRSTFFARPLKLNHLLSLVVSPLIAWMQDQVGWSHDWENTNCIPSAHENVAWFTIRIFPSLPPLYGARSINNQYVKNTYGSRDYLAPTLQVLTTICWPACSLELDYANRPWWMCVWLCGLGQWTEILNILFTAHHVSFLLLFSARLRIILRASSS